VHRQSQLPPLTPDSSLPLNQSQVINREDGPSTPQQAVTTKARTAGAKSAAAASLKENTTDQQRSAAGQPVGRPNLRIKVPYLLLLLLLLGV